MKSSIQIDLSTAVCFDTETSGLGVDAEICELTVIHVLSEKELFKKILKTKNPIPPEATAIHGITNDMSQRENSIQYYWDFLSGNLLNGKPVLGYNVFYDIKMLFQSYHTWEKEKQSFLNASYVIDVMQIAKNYLHVSKFLSLKEACLRSGIEFDETKAHGSAYDTLMTIKLFKKSMEI